MTNSEQKTIDSLYKSVQDLRSENLKFREDVKMQVEAIAGRVEQKHIPVSLEDEIVLATKNAMSDAIKKALSDGYNSPLTKYANNVIAKYQTSIESIFDKIIQEGIASDEFKVRVREVLLQKIAKTVISGIDGSVDKTINLMKQDAIFRSRLTLSVNGLVDEFLKQNK